MENQKGLITKIGEVWDAHRQQNPNNEPNPSRKLMHWMMPNGGTILLIILLIATQNVWAGAFLANNVPGANATTINYQGSLSDDASTPLNGNYNLTFALYDAETDGSLVWGPEAHTSVPVNDGLFNIGLGAQTSGGIPTTVWDGDRYLEITVNGETLTPREPIRSVPIAGLALTVPDAAIKSNHLAPIVEWVPAPSDVSLSNDLVEVAGTTVEVNTASRLWIIATCDCRTDDGGYAVAEIWVDGSYAGHRIIGGSYPNGDTGTGLRYNITNSYVVDVEEGVHTISLQVKLGQTGSGIAYRIHSGFSYLAVSQP